MEPVTSNTAEVIPDKAMIGEPRKIVAAINEMFHSYVSTSTFAAKTVEERKEFNDIVYNLMELLS